MNYFNIFLEPNTLVDFWVSPSVLMEGVIIISKYNSNEDKWWYFVTGTKKGDLWDNSPRTFWTDKAYERKY